MSRRNYLTGPGGLLWAAMLSGSRRAWYQTLNATTALLELMDRELQADCGVPLAFYDVLVEVYRAPGHCIRMSELADRVLLSRSWITRRVRQLEQAGLIARCASPDDGRGVTAALTPQGLEAFRAMDRSHAASIRRHFAAHLSAEEADQISRTFADIAAQARGALAELDV